MKSIVVLLASVAIVVMAAFAYRNSRFGVTTPDYRVVESEGPYEIRDYPSLVLVGTPMTGPESDEGTSFMRLFRYISGSNEADQRISMTTPVMTSLEDGQRRMSFIVPPKVAEDGAPRPSSSEVEVSTFERGLFAAYRFSGSWDNARFEEAVEKLERWLAERDIVAAGTPIVANYDPPFMPPILRRNEVLIRLGS